MASSSPAPSLPAASAPCPCGSGKNFGACCSPILSGQRKAATAEELMRARFSAHVVGDYAFLHRTFLPDSKKPYVDDGQRGAQIWTKLVVHSHEPGPNPDTAYVEFSAYFTQEGQEGVYQEKAEFIRQDGEWIFARPLREGPPPVRSGPKVGRNDPCPCGSGKKYKHCCLLKSA
jgi:SEC-C motif-containing protein